MDVWRERGNKRTSLVMSMYGDGGDKVSEFGLDGNPDDSWHFNVRPRRCLCRDLSSDVLTALPLTSDLPPGREGRAVVRVPDPCHLDARHRPSLPTPPL